ncbi:hypothetical protein ACS0TY_033202 [Phlomoides rotata]
MIGAESMCSVCSYYILSFSCIELLWIILREFVDNLCRLIRSACMVEEITVEAGSFEIKYYNGCLFHTVQKDFTAQTGDPTGTGSGGDSVYKFLYGDQAHFFGYEMHLDLKHWYYSNG